MIWNLLGILDFVVAVSLGVLSSGFVAGLVGTVTTAAMTQLPLVLIPAYFVPLFILCHLTTLLQARRLAVSACNHPAVCSQSSPLFAHIN